jgi:hypothetical protein
MFLSTRRPINTHNPTINDNSWYLIRYPEALFFLRQGLTAYGPVFGLENEAIRAKRGCF